MSDQLLVKMSPRPPAELCRDCELDLDDAALALLANQLTPSDFLRQLIAASLYTDAIGYLAAGLPRREAVWWACQCVRETAPAEGGAEAMALAAAEAWVYRSDDKHREIAAQQAERVGLQSPGGLVAQAAAWSGGSLAPEGLEAVPPPEHLTGRMAAAAIVVAATRLPPQALEDSYKRFLTRGIEIAMGSKGGAAKQPANA